MDLLAARLQMAMSLAFHIIFAVLGIGLPLLMVVAESLWYKTKKEVYLTLAKHWAKGTAILFAVGAVSGTVLSFELGLLWPNFMRFAGPIIGLPFALEGFAFFTEAIFLGIYLYGWQRVSPQAHIFAGVVVALSGLASAIFVVIANAWMNTPSGFTLVNGWPTNIDPIAAMLNPNAFAQTLHMTVACYAATGFLVAGVHAYCLLKDRGNLFHRRALAIALTIGGLAAIIEPLTGDILARAVAFNQPLKLAAFEALFKTQAYAPFAIGGLPDVSQQVNKFAIEIPGLLSFLISHDFKTVVQGLDAFPRELWPNITVVHLAFQIMIAVGSLMALVPLWALVIYWQTRRLPDSPLFLKVMSLAAPLGFVCIEAGWCVTEVGRQPWVIYGVMKTAHAVTPMPGLIVSCALFSLLYLFLFAIVAWMILWQIQQSPVILQDSSEKGDS
jgi:cytochrome d ubiquinol oxidase subunit I